MVDVSIRQEGPVTVATVSGEVDMSNGLHLSDQVLARMPDDAVALVIDLTELSYIDSAGVRAIFEISHTLALRSQGLAVVVHDGSPLRSVLKVTRVEEVAALCSDVAEAAASFTTG